VINQIKAFRAVPVALQPAIPDQSCFWINYDQVKKPFKDGFYNLPTSPGWGFSIDEDYLKKARVDL
jgi:L-alanine-DL-glutamate epimerase-like enolase superfamily enzyme